MNSLWTIKKKTVYGAFIAFLLTSEFFYIKIGGGTARPYHFVAVFVVAVLYQNIPKLFASRVFLVLVGFFLVNFISASVSNTPERALLSLISLFCNISISVAIALILLSHRVRVDQLVTIVVAVTLVSIVWALIQILSYKFIGINLALSDEQVSQIRGGFGPGLRTEANTFAKYLNLVFLLLVPNFMGGNRINGFWIDKYRFLIFAMLLLGMLICLTRSAIYGLAVTLLCIAFYYVSTGREKLFNKRFFKYIISSTLVICLYVFIVDNVNEYAAHKIATLFSVDEILEGESSTFRLYSQLQLYNAFVANGVSVSIGNGWGQVFYSYGDDVWQAGGAEILTALAYGGIFSGFAYVGYMVFSILAFRNMAIKRANDFTARSYEGFMFANIGLFITGQINGSQVAPEDWMLFGVAIFCSTTLRTRPISTLEQSKLSPAL